MGLSRSLLLVAVLVAAVPIGFIGLHPPRSVRDLEKAIVSGAVVLAVGAIVVHGFHDLDFFGLAHLLYLLGVVTLPLLFGAWFVLGRLRGLRRIDVGFGVVAAAAALLGLYGTHVEPNWLRVAEFELATDVSTPLRIGVIADLQTPDVGDHERNAINQVLDRDPDIVVVPGDWYQGEVAELEANRGDFVDLLRELVDNAPLVAVTTGDSDHAIPLRPIVEEAGALFIDDTVVGFELKGVPVRLAGVRVLADGPDRANTLAALGTAVDGVTLLVAHRPDAVYDLPDGADVDLVISGHTHGGQIAIPFFGPPVTFSAVPRSIAAGGLSIVDGVPLLVSKGVGLERLEAPQVRIGARPEVAIIDLVPS